MQTQALLLIEDMCYLMCGSLLVTLGMSVPDRGVNDALNRELEGEREYNRNELDRSIESVQTNVRLLSPKLKVVYDMIINAIDDGSDGLFLLDVSGGTGKTFLMSLVLATVRANSRNAIAIASSGIAATLLEGCRTANSTVKTDDTLQNTLQWPQK